MMKRLLLVVFSLMLLYSCNDIEKLVILKYKTHFGSGDCIVDLADITVLKWDSAYFYTGYYSREDIERELGEKLYIFNELSTRMIFFKQGKIAYIQEWFFDPWDEYTEYIAFDFLDGEKFVLYPNDAKVRVVKNGRQYVLYKYRETEAK